MDTQDERATWRMRPARLDDLMVVGAMFRARDVARYGTPELTDAEIAHDWRRPGFDLSADAVVAEDGAGSVVGYADVLPVSATSVDGELVVAPDQDERRLEGVLRDWLERRVAARAPRGAQVAVHIVVPSVEPQRAAWYESSGYARVRTFLRMRLEPDASSPPIAWPDGIRGADFRQGVDDRAAYEVNMEAFAGHFGLDDEQSFDEWRREAIGHPEFDPTLWVMAWQGDAPVGTLAGYPEESGGWVRRVAVARAARGRGLGLALLADAIRRFRERGLAAVELGVDSENASGATRLYERAGMRVTRRYDFYARTVEGSG